MENQINHNKSSCKLQYKKCGLYQIKHYHFALVDSTNQWAKEWQAEGLTLVTASAQSRGRGRLNRAWFSPKGKNLYATFCLFLLRPEEAGQIGQLLALSAAQMLQKFTLPAALKWPNDLLVEQKKIAGVLCETRFLKEKQGLLCGIGLNVNMDQEEAGCIDQKATSMAIELKEKCSLELICNQLSKQFCSNLQLFFQAGFTPFLSSLQSAFIHRPGQIVEIGQGEKKIKGQFIQVNEKGALELKLFSGEVKPFYSGELMEG